MIRTKTTVALLALFSYLAVACSSDGEDNTGSDEPMGSGGGVGASSSSGGAAASSGGSGSNSGGASSSSGGASSNSGGASSSSGGASTSSGGAASGSEGNASGGQDSGSGGSEGTDAVMSDGCSTERTLQNGTIMISSGGGARNYILRVPDSYDNNHPYRLVFAFAELGSSAQSVADRDYFTLAALDSEEDTIFVAPDAANGAGTWNSSDLDFTDAILMEVENDLCIDTTRIFATGFSFGGAMSLAIACQRADVFRGVAFFSGADLTGSCTAPPTTPIAYYASQASGDSSGDPIPSSGRIKQAQFAEVNGCTPEPNATTFPAPGQPHTCTEYTNCSEGHPTKYCVFDGPHGWEPIDPGESMSWNAPLAWEFITQF